MEWLGREVWEPCRNTGLGAGACQAQMGSLVVVKITQPLLKTQAQQSDPTAPVVAIPTRALSLFAFPCHYHPSLGSVATAAHRMPQVPNARSPLQCQDEGSLLLPAPGMSTLTQHPPQCRRCWASPIPAGGPTLCAVSYFFFNAPKSPVCFFNCSNHKREVSEQYKPVSTRKGEPPPLCARHRSTVPGGFAAMVQRLVAVVLSIPLLLPLIPSSFSLGSEEFEAGLALPKGLRPPQRRSIALRAPAPCFFCLFAAA